MVNHTYTTFDTDYFHLTFDASGTVSSIRSRPDRMEYLAPSQPAPLLKLGVGDRLISPVGMEYDAAAHQILLTFDPESITATVGVRAKTMHVTFELLEVAGAVPAAVLWGPYPTTIGEMVGETVGVVRNGVYAIGIQALNIHTWGGYPSEYPGCGAGDDTHAAAKTPFGSVVQAASRETDGGVIGSKIALFGCLVSEALATIGRIEVEEGLPHPMLDGEWCKTSRTARLSYLITGFGEDTVEEAIRYADMAGFTYFYHEHPFDTWGHFRLRPDHFPNGIEGLRKCVEQAERADLRVGVHILSNFITHNDPYVTPAPDPRLIRSGVSRLTDAVDAVSTEIHVDEPAPFRERGALSAAMIGGELIQYRTVSETPPWRLLGCRRGAFDTPSADHASGAEIGKLTDHPYRVFFPDLEMQDEIADRLVHLFNRTGLRQISFDGLEGCGYTGHGMYAHSRFAQRCFDGWNGEVVNDASRLLHYLWHIHTRMNWGEPWNRAAREGQTEYRMKNQEYFRRNLFPRMLGWFQLRLASGDLEATTLDDMEWALAKCAGFDAGFALSAALEALDGNGQTEVILRAVKDWEAARLGGAFSQVQQERLRNPKGEFHLERIGEGRWDLYPVVFSPVYSYREQVRQPGEPLGVEWTFENPHGEQPLRFVLRTVPEAGVSDGDALVHPALEVNFHRVILPFRMAPNQYLVCEGDGRCLLCDVNWNTLETIELSKDWPVIAAGENSIAFGCDPAARCRVDVRIKTFGAPERVGGL